MSYLAEPACSEEVDAFYDEGACCLGLAAAAQQLVWVVAPFLLVGVPGEGGRPRTTRRRLRVGALHTRPRRNPSTAGAVGREVLLRNRWSCKVTRPCRSGSCAAEPPPCAERAGSRRLERDTQRIGWGLDVIVDAWLVGPISRP